MWTKRPPALCRSALRVTMLCPPWLGQAAPATSVATRFAMVGWPQIARSATGLCAPSVIQSGSARRVTSLKQDRPPQQALAMDVASACTKIRASWIAGVAIGTCVVLAICPLLALEPNTGTGQDRCVGAIRLALTCEVAEILQGLVLPISVSRKPRVALGRCSLSSVPADFS